MRAGLPAHVRSIHLGQGVKELVDYCISMLFQQETPDSGKAVPDFLEGACSAAPLSVLADLGLRIVCFHTPYVES